MQIADSLTQVNWKGEHHVD